MDAGCGEGFIADLIYKNMDNIEIVGLEYTREALEIARELNDNITYVQGDINRMTFDTGAFDIVLCMEVLEHLPEPGRAIQELIRVSKDLLIITVPDEPWFCLGNLLALKNISRLGNPIDHINHWTFKGFRKFVGRYINKNIIYSTSFPWTIVCHTKDRV